MIKFLGFGYEVPLFRFQVSGVSAASGLKSGQFDRTWNWSCIWGQITNHKHQITNKSQIPISNYRNPPSLSGQER